MRTTTRLAVLAAAALMGPVGLLSSSGAAAAPVEETRVQPGALSQGEAPAVPYVEGRTLVDGDRRLTVPGRHPYLLGRAGKAYVVSSGTKAGNQRVLRLERDGSHRVLLRDTAGGLVLSTDGSRLVEYGARGAGGRVDVLDTRTGEVLHQKGTGVYVDAVAADRGRVVLSRNDRLVRTYVWDLRTDRLKVVSRRSAYHVDLGLDRMASFTKDPYDGGCTVVSRFSAPGRALWRSCREAVVAFSPKGRMATIHKLTDGIGPGEVWARGPRGGALARYTTDGWFQEIVWETGTKLLLGTHARRQTALVRCEGDECERATGTRPTEWPRSVA